MNDHAQHTCSTEYDALTDRTALVCLECRERIAWVIPNGEKA